MKQWRDAIKLTTENCSGPRQDFIAEVKTKVAHYEDEYHKLKEATSMLELALWKNKINETNSTKGGARKCKKVKVDYNAVRNQCRVNCGANIIIENVLPYLVR